MSSRDCPCVVELMPIISDRVCVDIIGEYLHRGDADIIKSLTRGNRKPYLRHGPPWDQELLTSAESQDYTLRWYRDYDLMSSAEPPSDRWVFEVGIRGPMTPEWTKEQFVRFLGTSSGMPQINNSMMRCIIAVVHGKIVVDIDTILVNINPAGDFGTYHGTPFMRSRRSRLRAQMYNLSDRESDHESHILFDRLCDLVHRVLWAYLH